MASFTGGSLRLLSLDATGTLFRPSPSVFHHYLAALERFTPTTKQSSGLLTQQIDERIFFKHFLDAYTAQSKALPAFGAGTQTSSRDWWSFVVKRTFVNVLGEETVNALPYEDLFDDLYRRFSTRECWTAFSDAESLLRTTKSRNPSLPIVVVSNFDERLVCHMVYYELR